MNLSELTSGIDRLIPTEYAEPWDHVGFQVGDPSRPAKTIALALDLTLAAIRYANTIGADMIICHHPPIFEPLTGIRLDHLHEALFHELIKSDLSLLALHTNLDAVPGGVADQFAALLGLKEIETLARLPDKQTTRIPLPESPWSSGFRVAPGFGRTGCLPEPTQISVLAGLLRHLLETPYLMIAADGDSEISRISVCPGSFDESWIPLLKEQGSELLICGEIKYHSQLTLVSAGIAVISTGHDVSERVVLQPLADLLGRQFPEITFAVCPPFDYNRVAF